MNSSTCLVPRIFGWGVFSPDKAENCAGLMNCIKKSSLLSHFSRSKFCLETKVFFECNGNAHRRRRAL